MNHILKIVSYVVLLTATGLLYSINPLTPDESIADTTRAINNDNTIEPINQPHAIDPITNNAPTKWSNVKTVCIGLGIGATSGFACTLLDCCAPGMGLLLGFILEPSLRKNIINAIAKDNNANEQTMQSSGRIASWLSYLVSAALFNTVKLGIMNSHMQEYSINGQKVSPEEFAAANQRSLNGHIAKPFIKDYSPYKAITI